MLTVEQKFKFNAILVSYVNRIARAAMYWDSDFGYDELCDYDDDLAKKIADLDIDFNNLTASDLEFLGFMKCNDNSDIWLIPLYLYNSIAVGTPVIGIDGSSYKWGAGIIDTDNHIGYLNYGIKAV